MIEFRDVHKSFGNLEVLKGINLNIEKGQVVTLIGPSGSGKSTILRCINLLEKPTKGQVFIDGTDITVPKADIQAVRKNIGMVFQHFNLFPHMTVMENMTYAPVKVNKIPKDKAAENALELLKLVGLVEKADAYPGKLSGGQKQRLCIARALLKKPKILILDDSTSAVDTRTDTLIRRAFAEEIPDTTKFIIAQRISSVQDADRILVLDDGRVAAFGTHDELLASSEIYRDVYDSQMKGADDDARRTC